MDLEIEAYINGELTGDALLSFEQQLLLDTALQAQVEQQRQLKESLEYLKIQRLVRAAVKDGRRVANLRRWLGIGLAAFLLFGTTFFVFWAVSTSAVQHKNEGKPSMDSPSTEDRAKFRLDSVTVPLPEQPKVPKLPPQPPTNRNAPPIADAAPAKATEERLRGAVESIDSSYLGLVENALLEFPLQIPVEGRYKQIANMLQKRDYGAVLPKLSTQLEKAPKNDTLLYFLAVAELQTGRPTSSQKRLYLLDDPGSVFQDEAQWMGALGYLIQGKSEAARLVLETLAKQPTHRYNKAAIKLLEELE